MTASPLSPDAPWWADAPSLSAGERRYLDLLRRTLTREAFLDQESAPANLRELPDALTSQLLPELRSRGWRLMAPFASATANDGIRAEGRDWPPTAETMVGGLRLENALRCACRAIEDDVPGDFIETGVWRGGVTILLRAVLAAYDDTTRNIWVADSFQGLPAPNTEDYPADTADFSGIPVLAVSADQVRANFARYDLLDDQVRFLEGWFSETLETAPIEKLALLRLDGDLYESTMDALRPLFPKVSPGGFVVVDDYGAWESCRAAVDEYRNEHGIDAPLHQVDWTGHYWRQPLR